MAAFRLAGRADIPLIIIVLNYWDVIYKQVPFWVETLLILIVAYDNLLSQRTLLILNLSLGDDWQRLLFMAV